MNDGRIGTTKFHWKACIGDGIPEFKCKWYDDECLHPTGGEPYIADYDNDIIICSGYEPIGLKKEVLE